MMPIWVMESDVISKAWGRTAPKKTTAFGLPTVMAAPARMPRLPDAGGSGAWMLAGAFQSFQARNSR